jgi:hypothetical protein
MAHRLQELAKLFALEPDAELGRTGFFGLRYDLIQHLQGSSRGLVPYLNAHFCIVGRDDGISGDLDGLGRATELAPDPIDNEPKHGNTRARATWNVVVKLIGQPKVYKHSSTPTL